MQRLPAVEEFLVSEWGRVGLEKLVVFGTVKTVCFYTEPEGSQQSKFSSTHIPCLAYVQ